MARRRGKLHLNAFLMREGHHEAAWRLPDCDPFKLLDVEFYCSLARIAERGKLDSLFLADRPMLRGTIEHRPDGALEPTMLLAALSRTTERIGLIATASTTYNEPYNLARRFSTLDFLSNGRAGWNVVTTDGVEAARNFNLEDLPAHRERYARATEFIEVAKKLWDSWADDAIIGNKAAGVWGDDSKLYPTRHHGRFFRVNGPLNLPRSPQGYPLIVQAGSSDNGKKLAARHADTVFTAQQTPEGGRRFYSELKSRARDAGRDPDTLKILPGVVPVVGATEVAARALAAELERLVRPTRAVRQLAQILRVPPEALDLDRELPKLLNEDQIEGSRSRFSLIVNLARREGLTVRQLIGRLSCGRGHYTITGTPEQIADNLQFWWESSAADGFNVMPAVLPSGLSDFVDHVVPLLQERGLFRAEYEGATLRAHYGLTRPSNANLVGLSVHESTNPGLETLPAKESADGQALDSVADLGRETPNALGFRCGGAICQSVPDRMSALASGSGGALGAATLAAVAGALPPTRYSQEEILEFFPVRTEFMRKMFHRCGVEFRQFYSGAVNRAHPEFNETQQQLLDRHRKGALELGADAAHRCLALSEILPVDVGSLWCVSSSGFLLPGLSARFVSALGLSATVHRADLVGMGCSAALNALHSCSTWVAAGPERVGLVICCEINSALHVSYGNRSTAVVNSLFADGCAAAIVRSTAHRRGRRGGDFLGFSSFIIPDALDLMRYEWSEEHGRFEFLLDAEVPRTLARHLCEPVLALLDRLATKPSEVTHWVVHGGGKAVIMAVGEVFDLPDHKLRYTRSVLANHGNLGSSSVLFCYEALLQDRAVRAGDLALLLAMGPGLSIECALLRMNGESQ